MVEIIATCGVSTVLLTTVVVVVTVPAQQGKNKDQAVNADVGKKLLKFLNEANDQYLKACESNNIEYFAGYCTRSFCDRLVSIIYTDAEVPLYSQKAYSMIEWRIVDVAENGDMEIEKIVRFRDIRVNGARVKLSEDTREVWQIKQSPKGTFRVAGIL